jgi:hypothetical protein
VVQGNPTGRPTVRTDAMIETIRRALRDGCGYKIAAYYAGVPEQTLRRWRQEDPDLSIALQMAHVRTARISMRTWAKAAKTDWKAAAEFMARFHPTTPEVDEEQLADIAARVFAYGQAMRGTVPAVPASNGHDSSA